MKLYRVQDDPLWKPILEFGDELPKVKVLPERLKDMYRVWDKHPTEHCKTCQHLIRVNPGQRYFLKCDLSPITHGAGTDWRANRVACGKWTMKINPIPKGRDAK